jgi:hypothetical protein
MKKPKITLQVKKEDIGYSANALINDISINVDGNTFDELKEMALDAINLAFEPDCLVYSIDEIGFVYDLPTFFEFYRIINQSALSKRIKMPQSLLAQYINGIKKPSVKQTERILKGVQQLGRELSEVKFIL